MKRLPLPLWLVFKTNLIKTIIINFRLLPKKQAWRLPIVLIGKVNISGCTGKVIIKDPIYTGMAILGELPDETCAFRSLTGMRLKIQGTLELESHIHLRGGGGIIVGKRGFLHIGRDTMINSYSLIWCVRNIFIGKYVRFSWNVQLFDSNFHYVIDEGGMTRNCSGEVTIGDNVWVGNHCTLNKGTVLPNSAIVASGSIVNKDFSKYGDKIMIGGTPAKYIKSGYRRLVDRKKQIEVDRYFADNPNCSEYFVGNDVI